MLFRSAVPTASTPLDDMAMLMTKGGEREILDPLDSGGANEPNIK